MKENKIELNSILYFYLPPKMNFICLKLININKLNSFDVANNNIIWNLILLHGIYPMPNVCLPSTRLDPVR